jgi:hypothetical protein
MIYLLLVDACTAKVNMMWRFFLTIAEMLPVSPPEFNLQYLINQINVTVPWGMGGIITELLSGIVDYLKLVVSWKFVKLLINVLGSKL